MREQRAESEKQLSAEYGATFDRTKIKPRYMVWENVCVLHNTLIDTERGFVQIDQVVVGDKVRTHLGRYMPVVKTYRHENKDVIKLTYSTYGEGFLICTPNHPIFGRYVTDAGNYDDPEFIPAGEITDNFQIAQFHGGDIVFTSVDNIETLSEKETVYNLSILEDNTYVANGVICHNCGAFSSGKPSGADFQAVLEEVCKVVRSDCPVVPIPKDGWPSAGNLDGVGDDGTPFSICWRLHDAQYWGVPQRRRRIALVADFGGTTAPEILFESDSMQGNSEPSSETRKGTPDDLANSSGGTSGSILGDSDRKQVDEFLAAINENAPHQQDLIQSDLGVARTLACGTHASGPHLTKTLVTSAADAKVYGICSFDSNAMKSDNPESGIYEADSARTLDLNGGNPACNQGGMAIVQSSEPTAYRGDAITSPVNASNPMPGDPCHTLTADDRNYVVQPDAIGCDIYNSAVTGDVAASLTAQGSLSAGGSEPSVIAFTQNEREEVRNLNDVAGAISAESGTHQQNYVMQPVGECLNSWDVQSKHIQPENGVAESLYAAECRYGGGESYVLQKEPVLLESNQNHATIQTDGISTTLPASMGEGGGYVPMVAIEGNGTRDSHKGDGYAETETMYTLNTVEQHAVAYAVESHAQDARYNVGDTNQTLGANMEHDPANGGLVLCSDVHGFQGQVGATVPLPIDKELSPTMVKNQIPDVVYATQACGDRDNSGQSFSEEVAYTIPANPMSDRGQAIIQAPVQSMELFHCTSEEELAAPLKARDYKDPQVVAFEPGAASRVGGHVYTDDTAGTLRAEMGDNQQAIVHSAGFCTEHSAQARGIGYQEETAPTLREGVVPAAIYNTEKEPVVLNDQGGQQMDVTQGATATLRAESHGHEPIVFDPSRRHDCEPFGDVCETVQAAYGTGGNNVPFVINPEQQSTEDSSVVFENHSQDTRYNELGEVCQTVSATWGMGGNNQPLEVKPQQAIVRRLTPLECTRLQGFPDGWVDIGDWVDENGKKHKDSDSPKYKALGNSIALPFWDWMAGRMVAQLKKSGVENPTMASLFDGIAGFPYVYIRHGCTPRWASEIESYPIAVCKKHFGDEETGEVGDIDQYLKLPPNWRSAVTQRERVTDQEDRVGSASDLNDTVIGSLCASDYKGIRNQDIGDGKAILQRIDQE